MVDHDAVETSDQASFSGKVRNVLVEGPSDAAALEVVTQRLGLGVTPVVTAGVTNFARFIEDADGGLYDKPEQEIVAAALGLTPAELEVKGFFACDRDLEDELLRAVGADRVVEIAESQGELRRFRALQQQPEWREATTHEQLRRWFGSGARRKIRYARLLAEIMQLDKLPAPIRRLITHLFPEASP